MNLGCQIVAIRELFAEVLGTKPFAQIVDPLPIFINAICRPGGAFFEKEDQSFETIFCCTLVFELSDRTFRAIWLLRWDMSVTKGKDSDVDLAGPDILKAVVERTVIPRLVIFHADDLVFSILTQNSRNFLAALLQIIRAR